MKHAYAKTFVLLILLIILFPMNVLAKSCDHNYNNDICEKCGYVRIHEFKESIQFYTIKDNVPVWSLPTKNSDLVEQITERDQKIDIDGITRNQYGNIWLRTSNMNGYIYIENLYLDFDILAKDNHERIVTAQSPLNEFYNTVKEGGTADYKRWLDPSSKGIEYIVNFNDRCCKMTAEELGNIHYGYLGRLLGFPSEVLLYAGGVVNQAGKLDSKSIENRKMKASEICADFDIIPYDICVVTAETIDIITEIYYECSSFYCDKPDDAIYVKKGINYYKTGKLK